MALPILEKDISHISKLADEPNDVSGGELSASDLKAEFDRAGNDIKTFLNDTLIPAIVSDIEAAAEGVGAGGKIGEEKIADGAITSAKIAALAVLTSAIADLAVTTAKIEDGAVTEAKIEVGAVTTKKIAGGAVVRDSLADESVSANKIYPGAVTSEKIANSAVTTPKIADASVTRAKLANDALYSPWIILENVPEYTLTIADIGKSFRAGQTVNNITLNSTNATAIPLGAEFAVLRYSNKNEVTITFDGVNVCSQGWDNYIQSGKIRIPDNYGMIALKKVTAAGMWLVTGNVEVVS